MTTSNQHLTTRTPSMGYTFCVVILCQAISLFLYSPALWMAPPGRFVEQYEPLTWQPFATEMIGEAQTRHRILGPVIAYALGLHGLASAVIPILGVTITLICVYFLVWQHIDPRWAFATTLLMATTQTCISSQTWIGYQDALGAAAVAGCLLTSRPWFASILLMMGMLAEERCAVGAPFIIMWHISLQPERRWNTALRWSTAMGLPIVLWLAYFYVAIQAFVPVAVQAAYEPERIGTSWRLLFKNTNHLAIGFFQSIRGGWILIGYAGWKLWQRRAWLPLFCGSGVILGGLLQAGMVADISRSASNIWPAILLSLLVLRKAGDASALTLLKTSLYLNLLSPCYQVLGTVVQYYYPLPISLLRFIYRI